MKKSFKSISKSISKKFKRSNKKGKKISKKKYSRFFKFGYQHNQGPHLYNVSTANGGILLANNAFTWAGNPETRAENA